MDIPVRNHKNNAYEAARQAEREQWRRDNDNIHKAIYAIMVAVEHVERYNSPMIAASNMRVAVRYLNNELKKRGERKPIDGD